MSTVVMHAVVSVDGFIAADDDQVGPSSAGPEVWRGERK